MKKSELQVSVTWQRVTPEAAEQGDFDSHGYMVDGLHYELDECNGVDADETLTGRGALAVVERWGGFEVSHWPGAASASFYGEPQPDYRTSADTTYTVHVKGDPRLVAALVRAVKP